MRLFQKAKEAMKNEEGVSLMELIIIIFFIVGIAAIALYFIGHVQAAKILAIIAAVIFAGVAITIIGALISIHKK